MSLFESQMKNTALEVEFGGSPDTRKIYKWDQMTSGTMGGTLGVTLIKMAEILTTGTGTLLGPVGVVKIDFSKVGPWVGP